MSDAGPGKPIPFDPDWTMRPGVILREMMDDAATCHTVPAASAGMSGRPRMTSEPTSWSPCPRASSPATGH